jgi:hypothetical protein
MSGFSLDSLNQVQAILSSHPDMGWFDFTRCVRPDGSAYGTGGVCRKGTPEEKAELKKLKADLKMAQGAYAYQKDRDPGYAAHWKSSIDKYQKRISEIEGNIKGTTPKPQQPSEGGKNTTQPQPAKAKGVPAKQPQTLTEAERKTLVNYMTGGGMETGSMLETNWKLRGLAKGPITEGEKTQIRDMDSALRKTPGNTEERTYYRGVSMDKSAAEKLLKSVKPGSFLKDAGFSSYSRDRNQAEEFADQGGVPVIFITKTPKIRDVKKYAPEDMQDQEEGILPRNTRLKVSNVAERGGSVYVTLEG